MRARPFSRARALRTGMASRQIRNIARTFTPLTRSHCSSVISSTKARPLTPALLNRMSRAPNRETAAATIRRGASSPVMSQANAATALLSAWACSIAESGRSTARTCAPSSAKSLADAAPMPDAAPVTIAILPASLSHYFLLRSFPPPSHGGGAPQGRRGKAAVASPADYRSQHIRKSPLLPLPPSRTLPRMTGEEEDSAGAHAIVRTTLPVALRDKSAFMASAPFSSGKRMEMCGFSLPSPYHFSSSSKFLRASAGSRPRQAP